MTAAGPTAGRWSRRQFVVGSGAAAVGVLGACSPSTSDEARVAARGAGGRSTTVPAEFDPSDWGSVRDQFDLDPDLARFAHFVFASHPRPVRDAIERHRAGLDADADAEGYLLSAEADAEAGVRQAAASYLGGEPGQVALTEHHDGDRPGLRRHPPGRGRRGADHRARLLLHPRGPAAAGRADGRDRTAGRVALYDDPAQADAGEMVERLASAVTPATRVVAVTWVHSGTGVKLPVADMAAARRDRGRQPLLCVDGSTGWAPRTPLSPTWAATSSWPAPTSGSTGRVAPASSGPRPRRGTSST